ncbi:MAG: hypothetical protein E6G95_17585 [Alphaproteobacteria bacterium]|nr:MAG: hypothetical protein E6G95_17585 [Alphaproteobacteria bacterium]
MIRWLFAAALLSAIAPPASAEWTKNQRVRFVGSCIEGCQATPNLSGPGKAACPTACNCLADQGEKTMTPADFEEADKAAAKDKMTPKMDELAKHFPACARQALGR